MFIWTCDDPAGNTWTAKLLHKFNDVVWHVSWSITGNILAVSGGDNKVEIFFVALFIPEYFSHDVFLKRAEKYRFSEGCRAKNKLL